jgi:hypothetical protein
MKSLQLHDYTHHQIIHKIYLSNQVQNTQIWLFLYIKQFFYGKLENKGKIWSYYQITDRMGHCKCDILKMVCLEFVLEWIYIDVTILKLKRIKIDTKHSIASYILPFMIFNDGII